MRDHPDDLEDLTEVAPESAFEAADVPGGPPGGAAPDHGSGFEILPQYETAQRPLTPRSVHRNRRRAKERGGRHSR